MSFEYKLVMLLYLFIGILIWIRLLKRFCPSSYNDFKECKDFMFSICFWKNFEHFFASTYLTTPKKLYWRMYQIFFGILCLSIFTLFVKVFILS
jgi:hypothetical protein